MMTRNQCSVYDDTGIGPFFALHVILYAAAFVLLCHPERAQRAEGSFRVRYRPYVILSERSESKDLKVCSNVNGTEE